MLKIAKIQTFNFVSAITEIVQEMVIIKIQNKFEEDT